jgi:hypothetical protein
MLNRKKISPFVVLAAAAVIAQACHGVPPSRELVPVEIWRRGDDGLTLRFADALEGALRASSIFTMSSGKKPGTLMVTIPDHVEWERVGNRTKVIYTLEFSTESSDRIGSSRGTCWDDDLSPCSRQALRDARSAADKMRNRKPD